MLFALAREVSSKDVTCNEGGPSFFVTMKSVVSVRSQVFPNFTILKFTMIFNCFLALISVSAARYRLGQCRHFATNQPQQSQRCCVCVYVSVHLYLKLIKVRYANSLNNRWIN